MYRAKFNVREPAGLFNLELWHLACSSCWNAARALELFLKSFPYLIARYMTAVMLLRAGPLKCPFESGSTVVRYRVPATRLIRDTVKMLCGWKYLMIFLLRLVKPAPSLKH